MVFANQKGGENQKEENQEQFKDLESTISREEQEPEN